MSEKRCIIKMDGGHSTMVRGVSAQDVEHVVCEARTADQEFLYLQPENFPDNGVVIDPQKVCMIIASPER